MKKYLLSLLLLNSAVLAKAAPAAELPADSVGGTDLQEVVVEGRTQRTIRHGIEYTPSDKMKRAAANASALLYNMQIPLLSVSPADGSVSKFGGGAASMFIDFKPASSAELQNMRTEDVLRVEVLSFPSDPRFGGADFVVNFIMRQYEWGGYTSATLGGSLLANDNANAMLFSRFVYKRMTFDASAGASLGHSSGGHSSAIESFRDIDFRGQHYDEIIKDAHSLGKPFSQTNNQWASFRADYNTPKFLLRQTLSFSRNCLHNSHSTEEVVFSPAVVAPTTAWRNNFENSITPAYAAYTYLELPMSNFLTASLDLARGHNHRNALYSLMDVASIDSRNKENTLAANATMAWSHKFTHNNTFRISLMSYNTRYRTRYMGNYEDLQRLLSSENMMFLEYMQNWGGKVDLYTRAGLSYVIGRVNGVNTLKQANPRMGAQLQYRPNQTYFFTWDAWWGNSHPQPSWSNEAMVQSDELLWLRGNPDMRNIIFAQTGLQMMYVPCNTFSLNAKVTYEGNYNIMAYRYLTTPGYDGLIRTVENNGDAHQYQAYVSAGLRLLDNKLNLTAKGYANHVVLTGLQAGHRTILQAGLVGAYYFGAFSASLYYASPERSYSPWNAGTYSRSGSYYGLSATYGSSRWNVTLTFDNWLRKYGTASSVYHSTLYSKVTDSLTLDTGRKLSLQVKYTFGYGKQVKRGGELGSGSGSSSAILR